MEFVFAVLFLLVYNLRPQDWVPGLAGIEIVRPIMGFWLLALVAGRSKPSPLQGFLRTPHDWLLTFYLAYIVFWGNASVGSVLPYLAFYFFTVQSLNTWDRIGTYLKYWTWSLTVIALLGVLSTIGIDLTHASENYFTQLGRLALGTWLHDNPNALAHSVIVVIALAFVLYFWKSSTVTRLTILPFMAGSAFYCAWLTQSKGSYLVGGILLLLAFVFGKPRWLQITAIAAALTVGISALSFLPRMSEMGNLRGDEGVQGRVLAWEMAKTAMEKNTYGVGWNQFTALIPWKEGNHLLIIPKATHSSYVKVGADLGKYGLFLYLSCLWCALHTLLVFSAPDIQQERCRRLLLLLITGLLLSGWMINREYHTEFFLVIAVSASVHRLKKAEELTSLESQELEHADGPAALNLNVFPTNPIATLRSAWDKAGTLAFEIPSKNPFPRIKTLWNRFGFLDLTLCFAFTWLTLKTWDYVLNNF